MGAVFPVEEVVHVQADVRPGVRAVAGHHVHHGIGVLAAVGFGSRFGGRVVQADGGRVNVGFALPAQAAAQFPAARGAGGEVVMAVNFEAVHGYAVRIETIAAAVTAVGVGIAAVDLPVLVQCPADVRFPAAVGGAVGGAVVGVAGIVAPGGDGQVVFPGTIDGGGSVQAAVQPLAFDARFEVVAPHRRQVVVVPVFLVLRVVEAAVAGIGAQPRAPVIAEAGIGGKAAVAVVVAAHVMAVAAAADAVVVVATAEDEAQVIADVQAGGQGTADLPLVAVLGNGSLIAGGFGVVARAREFVDVYGIRDEAAFAGFVVFAPVTVETGGELVFAAEEGVFAIEGDTQAMAARGGVPVAGDEVRPAAVVVHTEDAAVP